MKKAITLSLMALIATAIILQMVPQAFAEHTAEVSWYDKDKDEVIGDTIKIGRDAPWPTWLSFVVRVSSGDPVVKFKLAIPKDEDGYAIFRFWESDQNITGWSATPDEFDPDNWPTVVIFESNGTQPLTMEVTGRFDVHFNERRETVCEWSFLIYTIDSGTPPETRPHELHLIMDPYDPLIDMVTPLDGDTIEAIFDPYPYEWYLWINFTAYDDPDHDSNICRVIVDILEEGEDAEWDMIYEHPGEPKVEFREKYPDLDDGTYTLNVTVYDCAGNFKTEIIEFDFIRRLLAWLDPDEGTVNSLTTYDSETGVYTGNKDEYSAVEETKVLGTEVTIHTSPGAFTPNSKVDVIVHNLPYENNALVLKDVPTDFEGKFIEAPSFLFPTAPHGIYTVTLEDAEDTIVPLEFMVIPKIVYKPVIVIGPAPIEVIATGLPAGGDVVGLTCDDTDALLSANWHAMDWYTDVNGTLQTDWADKPGLLMPVLEPGTYEIGLNFDFVDEECHVNSISNLVAVVNNFKDLIEAVEELEIKLDYITPIIERIDGNVVEIITTLGRIEGKIDDLTLIVKEVDGRTVTILARVSDIHGWTQDIHGWTQDIHGWTQDIHGVVEEIRDDVAVIRTDVGYIRLKVDEILAAVGETATQETAGDIWNAVSGTELAMNLSTVMSTIAAIAAIAAVIVVVRRLKVAA